MQVHGALRSHAAAEQALCHDVQAYGAVSPLVDELLEPLAPGLAMTLLTKILYIAHSWFLQALFRAPAGLAQPLRLAAWHHAK